MPEDCCDEEMQAIRFGQNCSAIITQMK